VSEVAVASVNTAMSISETSVSFYETARHNKPAVIVILATVGT
jgi:hypothetical protein